MDGTRSGGDSPPESGELARTPIWISRRLQIALIAAGFLLLAYAIWLVPGILTVVIGAAALALILSFPVGWLSRVMPRGLAILVVLLTVLWVGLAFGLVWSVLAVPGLVVVRVLFDFFRVRLRVRPDENAVAS